jgi:hypothetical protein
MPNVEIGQNCTIGANSVINKSIPPNCLAAGAPAKVLFSDGAYLRVKSMEERLALVDEILDEMFNFMRFEGSLVKVMPTSNGIVAVIDKGKSPNILEYVRNGQSQGNQSEVFISFSRINDQDVQILIARNCSWLDIDRRQCFFGRSPKVHEVRNFFGRYGVRFSVWGE